MKNIFAKTGVFLLMGLALNGQQVQAQRAYEDDGEVDPKLAMNRATRPVDESGMERVAVRSKQAPLLDTFRGTGSKVQGDGIWKERGVATLWYDQEDQIISVEVSNNAQSNL